MQKYAIYLGIGGTRANILAYAYHERKALPLQRLAPTQLVRQMVYCCVTVGLLLCDGWSTVVWQLTHKLGKRILTRKPALRETLQGGEASGFRPTGDGGRQKGANVCTTFAAD